MSLVRRHEQQTPTGVVQSHLVSDSVCRRPYFVATPIAKEIGNAKWDISRRSTRR